MKKWIIFNQPHSNEIPQIINTKLFSNYLSRDDEVKSGDIAFLHGSYGLCGWGYVTQINVAKLNSDENKMFVKIVFNVFRENLVLTEKIKQIPELLDIYRDHDKSIVELCPKEFNALNKLVRLSGAESPEDIPEFEERNGKFGIKDSSSLTRKIESVVKKHNLASLLFLDLDNFKSVNDDYNHSVGDGVISEALGEVENVISGNGELFHRSGDEMIVLLPNLNNAESIAIAEDIRQSIENKVFSVIGQGIVTTTIGVATYPETCKDWKHLENQADEILMKAKKINKNSVSTS